jgi:hypothetical protein
MINVVCALLPWPPTVTIAMHRFDTWCHCVFICFFGLTNFSLCPAQEMANDPAAAYHGGYSREMSSSEGHSAISTPPMLDYRPNAAVMETIDLPHHIESSSSPLHHVVGVSPPPETSGVVLRNRPASSSAPKYSSSVEQVRRLSVKPTQGHRRTGSSSTWYDEAHSITETAEEQESLSHKSITMSNRRSRDSFDGKNGHRLSRSMGNDRDFAYISFPPPPPETVESLAAKGKSPDMRGSQGRSSSPLTRVVTTTTSPVKYVVVLIISSLSRSFSFFES